MEKQEIFAKRLKNARLMAGLSMEQLCEQSGNIVSKMAVSKYEKGTIFPSSTVLIAFAKTLKQNVDYFFRPFIVNVESVKFRKKSSLSEKKINSIKETVADFAERYISIEDVCGERKTFISPFNEVISNQNQVKEYAEKLRELWKLGEDGIVSVVELLEEKGIKVLEVEFEKGFDGLSLNINENEPVIVVNKNSCSERKRLTALHELGHIIFNFAVDEKEEENLCNIFANEMLISESVFKSIIGSNRHDISYQELKSIQQRFGISIDALMIKAKNLGVISEQRAKTYWIRKNQSSDFKSLVETSHYPNESSDRFSRLVYSALSKEIITASKASSYLNESLNHIMENLALV